MKKQYFFLGLAFLLGSISCTKEHMNTTQPMVRMPADSSLVALSHVKENHKHIKITVNTFAGSGVAGSTDGRGTLASFNHPNRIAFDKVGNLYVLDLQTALLRKISEKGEVKTLVSETPFYLPWGLAVDASGYVYVGDYYKIYKVSSSGVISGFVGSGQLGSADGQGTAASFYSPSGLTFDSSGNMYVSDEYNAIIRKVTPDGIVTTIAGTAGVRGSANGQGSAASFYNPRGIAVDKDGNLYIADSGNNMIRKISPAGVVTTLAGHLAYGSADGQGTAASFYGPDGVSLDACGNLYVADYVNNKIRKVSPQGMVTTVAGTGDYGFSNGPGDAASFRGPTSVAIDRRGDIYISDFNNNVIRKIDIK